MPINAETGGGVLSLTFVFAVAAIVLFGWAAGALLLLAATAVVQLAQHRPLQRIAFNVAVLALVALAAGALIAPSTARASVPWSHGSCLRPLPTTSSTSS